MNVKMKKKTVLFLLDDIWSLGKHKGVTSTYRLLQQCGKEFKCVVFTTDKYADDFDVSNFEIHTFTTCQRKVNNRYMAYILSQIDFITLNIRYIFLGLSLDHKPDLIYCSSSLPVIATWFLKTYYKVNSAHRIYGTFLYKFLDNKMALFKKYQEVLSFVIPADKYIITDDGTYGDKVATHFGIAQEKVSFLRNGVEKIQDYDRTEQRNKVIEELGMPQNAFIMLAVSRLANWKRVDRTIAAMNSIQNKDMFLLIIGDGPMKVEYENLATNPNILFLGARTHAEVQKYMMVADLFISMYDVSNIGNPLLEAFSAGLPIITYDSGDTSSVVTTSNGILIKAQSEQETIDKLYKNIMFLYNDEESRRNLANSAKNYADSKLYNWDQRMDIEVKALEELMR